MPEKIKVVEKENHLAVHGLFYSRAEAQHHIDNIIPKYIEKSYFIDKALTIDSFEVLGE